MLGSTGPAPRLHTQRQLHTQLQPEHAAYAAAAHAHLPPIEPRSASFRCALNPEWPSPEPPALITLGAHVSPGSAH